MSDELQIINEVKQVTLIPVIDEVSREQAVNSVIDLKIKRTKIVDYWKPLKEKAYQAHKEVTQREKEMLTVVDGVINQINGSIKEYLLEQEKIRIEAQRKVDEKDKKKAEDERARIEAEQKKAIEDGNIEKAVELEDKHIHIMPATKVSPLPQKTVRTESGTSTASKELVVEISNSGEFLKYCAEHGLAGLWEPKVGAIKTWVKAGGLKEVPGLKIYEDFVTSYRAAK